MVTNDGLCRLHTWELANRISINPDKTVFNVVSNLPQPDHPPSIRLDHCEIAMNNEITYLGILVDSKLKFNLHIKYVGNKMSKAIGIMSKIKFIVPKHTLLKLYYALVLPYLNYCSLVWGGTYDSHLHPLKILQKKIVRIICKVTYFHPTNELFHDNY